MTDMNVVSTLTVRARKMIQLQKDAGMIIEAATIAQAVQADAPAISTVAGRPVTSEEIEEAVRNLQTIFVTEQGEALKLEDTARPVQWYVGERRRPQAFLKRYLEKLEEEDWPADSIRELTESTARVIETIDDPERPGSWDWRGLVVGDVQSGKTAHYAGVVNRAADAGYRVIVILAGMHNVLRLQTQKRFDKDVLGWDTNPNERTASNGRIPIGVGLLDPTLVVDSITAGTINGDFKKTIADQVGFTPTQKPFVLIVKKNAGVLDKLNTWFAGLHSSVRAAPLLVVDDEADQASVDTGDQPILPDGSFDPDYDPKRVNAQIRRLLMSFDRRSYVGYTATPFANILIHDEREADGYGQDLFPKTFIVSLTPPDDYFGPKAVFGTNDEDDERGLPIIRIVDQPTECWIPFVHVKTLTPTYDGQDRVPPSLEEAINAFLITCAARAARGQGRKHSSMLVHVSRFVDVHAHAHRQVDEYLVRTRAMISGRDPDTIARLHRMWREDYEPTTLEVSKTIFGRGIVPITWEQVLARLADSSDKIRVITTNGNSKVDIDYDSYKETGLSVIAIGGDKLSRGLTLEGLSVSYFLRVSKQYDSLLQMGRWFGYRRGFADLCRLYTTDDMEDWFRHIATANKELRSQFFAMSQSLATPKDFGFRISTHSIMEVTALNKQRHGALHQSSYAGEAKIQTVIVQDKTTVQRNADATDQFLLKLGKGDDSPRRPGKKKNSHAKGTLWRDVPGGDVERYLTELTFPPESDIVAGEKLAQFINDQIKNDELTKWAVFLPTADGSEVTLGGRKIRCVLRDGNNTPGRFTIGTALSPLDQAIDLTDDEFEQALNATNAERASRNKKQGDVPSGEFIRKARGGRPENGLLIIYPIDPANAEVESKERPLIGIVVSFPDSPKAAKRIFLRNSVGQREAL